jgi:oligopeptide/dipeptide ABC transporter ATP-binding protein
MYAGALVETTDYRAMFASPRHPYTWALLSTLPRLNQPRRGVLPQIRGNPPDLGALTEQCSFLERCPKALTQCRTEAEPELRLVDGKSEHMVACYNMVAEGVV